MSNKNPGRYLKGWFTTILVLFTLISTASAEDIDIFTDEIPPSKPNILFLLDQSGSMRLPITGTTQSRADALKEAFNTLMSDPGLVDIDIGLMAFSNGNATPYPHGVSFPITPIDAEAKPIMLSNLLPYNRPNTTTVGYFTLDDDTLPDPLDAEPVREYLPRILSNWSAWGATPIVDAYHEAALYFRGDAPKWGLTTPEQNHAAHPSTYQGSSEGTITQIVTGNTATCATPDCGINCIGFVEQAACASGNTSCGLGSNCTTTIENRTESCILGTATDCLASNPEYFSCSSSSFTSCSTSCVSGVYHPETGLCIPDALNNFTIKTHAPNMCLEANGSSLTQEICDGTTEQVFYSTEARPGYVKIHSSADLCMDVIGGNTNDDALIGFYGCGAGSTGNQVFRISSGIGARIIADHSTKCIQVNGASISSGASITQFTCTLIPEQLFIMSNEATSCSTVNNVQCQLQQETTRCDHQKYSCDETSDTVTLDSTNIVYNSPIADKCENNAIVVLSDGEPYQPDLLQFDQTMEDIKTLTGLSTDCAGTDPGRCGAELAEFLATKDQSDTVDGDNVINTYTIGFDVASGSKAETFLTAVANAGGGSYFPASNAAALATVFKGIIADVSKTARSYAAPTYTVDPSSRLAHSRNLYIPLFENSAAPSWSGNLKKFKLNDTGQIVDINGNVAVSAEGILDPLAVDFWSDTNTASDDRPNPVTSGGAANNFDPATRNLLTNHRGSIVSLDETSVGRAVLSGGEGGVSADAQNALIKFIQGYEEDGTLRKHMGDILHSKPTVIAYSGREVIFFGTNEGYLHAIDTADKSEGGGKELFAYMPRPLLANIKGQYENTPLTGPIKRIYGVDGEITAWIDDKNKNGTVDISDGDAAYLFFGLRRGGHAYYALDVTNPVSPKLLWTINNNRARYADLGQTWSKPTMGKLRYKQNGSVKFEEVLVFGGGYDDSVYDEENISDRGTTLKGNNLYIINAKTGRHIWSPPAGQLKHSVPGAIRVLDMNRDGSIDRLYFGDTGGNIWRVDLNVDDFDDDASLHNVRRDARMYHFADLGKGINSGRDTRKFFYEPEVSTFKKGGRLITLVAIGSGYRSHPSNDKVKDAFFVLHDENANSIPETAPAALKVARDLVKAGNDFTTNNKKGWYMLLNNYAEKVLSSPLVFKNKVMFTTFALTSAPVETGGENSCTSQTNNLSRAYALDLMTGSATADLDGDGVVTDTDQSVITGFGDIPDSPKLVFNKPSNCTNDGCDHIVDVRVGKMGKPLIDGDTVDGNVNLGDYLPKVFWLNKNR